MAVKDILPTVSAGHLRMAGRSIGLPGKIDNANTKLHTKVWSFIYSVRSMLYKK